MIESGSIRVEWRLLHVQNDFMTLIPGWKLKVKPWMRNWMNWPLMVWRFQSVDVNGSFKVSA